MASLVYFTRDAGTSSRDDIMHAFNAFWALDSRSFHHLNEAYMILLQKKEQRSEISDYRPISLIHSFGKLLSKCLALRLAPWLQRLVQPNQSAFIRGRSIHDNFRSVRLNCMVIHKARMPCVLLKVDIAKAFDSVNWSFLLEILQHMGFPRRWRD
jgi:Ni/Fe-hydrogenase subunit HybB-like protein